MKVNRIEVIDWSKSSKAGRAYVKWVKDNFCVQYQVQDNGRTIKIFLTDEPDDRLSPLEKEIE